MKKEYSYQEIECKSALNHIHSRFLPYHYDLNIYRGCFHNCIYCYAQYSHRYLEDSEFFHHIYIKKNIVEQLEKKLKSKSWKRDVINLGGVTDSYQSIEEKYKIMPEILKLLIKYKTPAIISTKSSLILRDIELLKELSRVAGVQIAVTITTLNQAVANQIEPNASPVEERIQVIKKLKEAGLTVGWHLMPIIPYITGTKDSLEKIFQTAHDCQIDYMIVGNLNLKGLTRTYFLNSIRKIDPQSYAQIITLYQNEEKKKAYKKGLSNYLTSLFRKYRVSKDYMKYVPNNKEEVEQLSLF